MAIVMIAAMATGCATVGSPFPGQSDHIELQNTRNADGSVTTTCTAGGRGTDDCPVYNTTESHVSSHSSTQQRKNDSMQKACAKYIGAPETKVPDVCKPYVK